VPAPSERIRRRWASPWASRIVATRDPSASRIFDCRTPSALSGRFEAQQGPGRAGRKGDRPGDEDAPSEKPRPKRTGRTGN
jgi:hypothetical protein